MTILRGLFVEEMKYRMKALHLNAFKPQEGIIFFGRSEDDFAVRELGYWSTLVVRAPKRDEDDQIVEHDAYELLWEMDRRGSEGGWMSEGEGAPDRPTWWRLVMGGRQS